MSLHKSLKSKSALKRQRNVLKREERIDRLKKDERWSEEDSVFGLPKVKTVQIKKKGKDKKKKKKEEEETKEQKA